jgi:hypothetical protein
MRYFMMKSMRVELRVSGDDAVMKGTILGSDRPVIWLMRSLFEDGSVYFGREVCRD